jgi:hypothetical protein
MIQTHIQNTTYIYIFDLYLMGGFVGDNALFITFLNFSCKILTGCSKAPSSVIYLLRRIQNSRGGAAVLTVLAM